MSRICLHQWFFSATQCAVNYTRVLRVITSPRTQLTFNDPSVQLSALSVIVKGESSYAGLLGIKISSRAYLLFTGDMITIRTHPYVSNLFDTNTLPNSDDVLCAWAGSMQSVVCNLQLGNIQPTILPGHGPISDSFNYAKDIARNIAWLQALRNLTFNSCNATYIWNEMHRTFPDFNKRALLLPITLKTHVPANADSVNCNCNTDSPTICPVYNAPPTCIHLDFNGSDTTLACNMASLGQRFPHPHH